MQPFKPNSRSTIAVTVSTTPQAFQLPPGGGSLLQFINNGNATQHCYGELGGSSVTVFEPTANVPGGFPVHPVLNTGYMPPIRIRPTDTHVALVAEAGTPTVYMTRGDDV